MTLTSFREKARKEIEEAVKLGVHSIWLTVDTAVVSELYRWWWSDFASWERGRGQG